MCSGKNGLDIGMLSMAGRTKAGSVAGLGASRQIGKANPMNKPMGQLGKVLGGRSLLGDK